VEYACKTFPAEYTL